MDIRETYNNFLSQNLTLNDFDRIIELRNECKLTNNYEYYYLSTILQIDIYINEGLLDDALNITLKNFNDLDRVLYTKIYLSILERLIYIFIKKRNYRSAFRYADEKKKYIDNNNNDEVNRWYLEMAYIYEALQEKNKSLTNLLAILENNPEDSLKSVILGNIAKLYIDANDFKNASDYLEKCMVLTNKLKDKEGILYCDYLNAKILICEKKYKFAEKIFRDIFKNARRIDDEKIGYLNDFISLLINNEQYSDAKKYIDRFFDNVNESKDQYLRKDFYKLSLKVNIALLSNKKDDFKMLFDYIELIEKEIAKNDEKSIIEASEDSKQFEINEKLQNTIMQIENTIALINLAMSKNGERDSIFEYSKTLEKIVPFNDAHFVIFNRANFELLSDLYDMFSSVAIYSYKKQRLYERTLDYNDLNNTIVELLVSGAKDVSIDFSDTNIPLIEPISKATYSDLKIKWLYATPLNYDGDLYGCVIYTSSIYDLSNPVAILNLKIASKLLESRLINLYYQENLQAQNDILEVAMSGLQNGMFYYDKKNNRMALTSELASFLHVSNLKIKRDEYLDFIVNEDKNKLKEVDELIDKGQSYKINYTLKIENTFFTVEEQGKPYYSRDNIIKFYVCTINQASVIEKEVTIIKKDMLVKVDFSEKFKTLKEDINSKFASLELKFATNLNEYEIKYLYDVLRSMCDDVYYLGEKTFSIIESNTDQRHIDKLINSLEKKIETNGFNYYLVVAKYPKDINNIDDVFLFSSYILNQNKSLVTFNNNKYVSYLNYKNINNIVSSNILEDKIEILHSPIKMDNDIVGYNIMYNIPGIFDYIILKDSLTDENLIEFEKYLLDKILSDSDVVYTQFIELNVKTINKLIQEDYFKNVSLDKINSVIICINGYDNIENILNYLKKYNFKLFVNYQDLQNISFDLNILKSYYGVILRQEADEESFDIFRILRYQVLSFNKIENYKNCIYYTSDVLKL